MNDKAGYMSVSHGKGGPCGLGAELTCRLSGHISVINDQGGTSNNQSRAHSGAKY